MINSMASLFKELLLEHFLDFQREQGERKTLREFAKFLDENETTLNLLMNEKRPPSVKKAAKYAEKTGDMRFYAAVGAPAPDPNLTYITNVWEDLPPSAQKKLAEEAEKYVIDSEVSEKEEDQA